MHFLVGGFAGGVTTLLGILGLMDDKLVDGTENLVIGVVAEHALVEEIVGYHRAFKSLRVRCVMRIVSCAYRRSSLLASFDILAYDRASSAVCI